MNQQTFIEPVIRKSANLSGCGKLRYSLERWWNSETRVCWIMLNPSTADENIDDPTIKRCIHFTQSWGYGGLVVVNLFPFRSSNPADCRRWADWEPSKDWYTRDEIFYRNMPIVVEHAKHSDLIVAAWGAAPWAWNVADQVTMEIQEDCEPWPDIYCLGTTAGGAPKHPLARGRHRAPNDQQPVLWRVT